MFAAFLEADERSRLPHHGGNGGGGLDWPTHDGPPPRGDSGSRGPMEAPNVPENPDTATWFDLFSGGMNNPGAKSPRQGTSWERGAGGDLAAIFGASANTSNDGSLNKEDGSNAPRDRKADIRVRSAGGTTERSGSGTEDVIMQPIHGDPESAPAKDKPEDEKGDSNANGGKESAN